MRAVGVPFVGDWELAQVTIARPSASHQILWWVPVGARPTVADAEERLSRLRDDGPTPYAFTFTQPFAAPDRAVITPTVELLPPR